VEEEVGAGEAGTCSPFWLRISFTKGEKLMDELLVNFDLMVKEK
jgi:hypothetical protein